MADTPSRQDRWRALQDSTPARVGLGRSGASLPTTVLLQLALAHARARDAVHAAFDAEALAQALSGAGLPSLIVQSRAADRQTYLRRPDLGARLGDASAAHLQAGAGCDVLFVIGDGLSPLAVHAHAAKLVAAVASAPDLAGLGLGPVVIARGARVALGDDIGQRLGAQLVVMLIGERPGMSTPDSLGVYVTHDPRIGRSDAERNCISNIHEHGLSIEAAGSRLTWLIRAALSRCLTGVALKDESAPSDTPSLVRG